MCDCENLNVVLACTTVILLHEQSRKRKTNEEKLTAKKKKHSKSVLEQLCARGIVNILTGFLK